MGWNAGRCRGAQAAGVWLVWLVLAGSAGCGQNRGKSAADVAPVDAGGESETHADCGQPDGPGTEVPDVEGEDRQVVEEGVPVLGPMASRPTASLVPESLE